MSSSLTYREEYEQIQALQEQLPKWVSKQHIWEDLLPTIGWSAMAVTIVYWILLNLIKSSKSLRQNTNPVKIAYQSTNLLVNATLAAMGMYFHTHYRVTLNPTMTDLAIGNYSVYPVACLQLGYNAWSIFVGLFVVQESKLMIFHHISVVVTSFMTLFLPLGYRHFAPFMFGVLETSSVPLAIMNAFKDNPKVFLNSFPQLYTMIRIAFALTFLFVRWYCYFPIKYDYLRLYGMGVLATYHGAAGWYWFAYTALVWLASFFLAILQIYWGVLIVKGLLKIVSGTIVGSSPKSQRNSSIKGDSSKKKQF